MVHSDSPADYRAIYQVRTWLNCADQIASLLDIYGRGVPTWTSLESGHRS
jgi:hypothetical protein